MSTTISISIYAEENNIAMAFWNLLDRIMICSTIKSVKIYEKYDQHNTKHISIEHLISSSVSIAEYILYSMNSIKIDLAYKLASSRSIGISLYLYGKGYNQGLAASENGPIRICLSLEDFLGPLKNVTGSERKVTSTVLTEQGSREITDAEELFFRSCGILEAKRGHPYVKHAAVYLENGWPSAVACSMLYHRESEEFAKDFGRIYARYNWGTLIPTMFRAEANIWRASPTDPLSAAGPGKNMPEFYRQFSKPDEEEIIDFLDNLDIETAKKLSTLSGEFIKEELLEVNTAVPEVRCYDFGTSALALTTDLASSLWRAYEYIAVLAFL